MATATADDVGGSVDQVRAIGPRALAAPALPGASASSNGADQAPPVRTSSPHVNTGSRKKAGSWTDQSLQQALNKITDEGMKLKVASKVFGIPSSSLRDHLYGRTTFRQRGTKPTLKAHEEKK